MSLQPSTPGPLPPPSRGAVNRAASKHAAEVRQRAAARRRREEIAEARALGVAVVVKPRLDRSWSADEDAAVRALYPDVARLLQRLPHRSRKAIKHRAVTLGVVPKVPRWTSAEVATLRRLWLRATRRELVAALPRWTGRAIDHKARRLGLALKGRPPLALTGDPLCDAIRDRCRVLGISMRELDRMARTSLYWQACGWNGAGGHRLAPMVRALLVLGGEIDVRWVD